jgi:broad specificity phosphatase PhoE
MGNLILVRHGQASYLSDNYDQLSDKGREQAALLGKYFKTHNYHFTKYYTGPLERQKDTLSLLLQAYKSTNEVPAKMNIIQELREHKAPQLLREIYDNLLISNQQINTLDTEIKSDPSLKRKNSILIFNEFIKLWVSGKTSVLPGYDTWKNYKAEVKTIIPKIFTSKENTLVVTSGGTKTAIISDILDLENNHVTADINIHMKNTSITKFKISEDNISMISMNELPHLKPNLHTYV